MRIGVVSDLHCNAIAFERALELMGETDALFCLGDSIYEFRFSNEVVRILQREAAITIIGNHEEAFFSPAGARARASASVDQDLADWLAAKPTSQRISVDGVDFHLVHSTPWEPRGAYVVPEDPDLERFGDTDADVVLYGHTHRQLVREINGTLVINPGSAGDGRDHKNGRKLSCAVIETRPLSATVIDFDPPP